MKINKAIPQSDLGVKSDTINLYDSNGLIIGYFTPVDNWKLTYSMRLKKFLKLK